MLLRSWMERKYDLNWLLSEQNAEPMFFFYFYPSELCADVFHFFDYSVQLLLNLFILTVPHKKNSLTKTVCLKIEFHCCLYHIFLLWNCDKYFLIFRKICGVHVRVEASSGKTRPKPWMRRGPAPRGRRPFDSGDKCYQCGERGHYAYDCTQGGSGGRRGGGGSYGGGSRRRSRYQ